MCLPSPFAQTNSGVLINNRPRPLPYIFMSLSLFLFVTYFLSSSYSDVWPRFRTMASPISFLLRSLPKCCLPISYLQYLWSHPFKYHPPICLQVFSRAFFLQKILQLLFWSTCIINHCHVASSLQSLQAKTVPYDLHRLSFTCHVTIRHIAQTVEVASNHNKLINVHVYSDNADIAQKVPRFVVTCN